MDKLYTHTEAVHNTRSAEIVVPVILNLIQVKSVLDVGCGTGTWLKVFNKNFGLTDFLGLDGSYIDYNQLVIDRMFFKETDLRKSFDLQRNFDLVLCLEVAEHLPDASADDFVDSLCKHSKIIIFSAAIPGQTGQNHINEQWPEYWQKKFANHGYYFHDILRAKLWNNPNVDWWYRQNMFMVTKESNTNRILPKVHPDCFKSNIDLILSGNLGIKKSFLIFLRSIRNRLMKNK